MQNMKLSPLLTLLKQYNLGNLNDSNIHYRPVEYQSNHHLFRTQYSIY
ncbi:hypothetical protein XNC3_3220001 [Xenorhabdus nematophila F1]|uniref:Uncharacterized protein n=1 Tax=Xenorhabdus nematophila (strain ATCC 19061 / DSM 3370 / CCUG 14189 / LMG 1036 / NCIMB 9965 / AN6) TaxID=406817 RepID=D3VIZ3_XENNA|nr:hypothetical protein XNC1_2796 [Xenorhabdus nematophila ATCC 19061]CCW32061.1 hypothetical protein XNC3_3220001 [Xenorhabdus nematophila F1]